MITKPKTSKDKINPNQYTAIQLSKQLADTIISSPEIADIFLYEMKNIPIGTKRSEIMKKIPQLHPNIAVFSNETLRGAARIALKELMSDNEYKKFTKESMKNHGKSRIDDLQESNGTRLLTEQEKEILDAIAKDPTGYKNGSVRNIKKIMLQINEVINFTRSKDTIEGYLRQFSDQTKEFISRDKDPGEVQFLRKLFDAHYVPGKKLTRIQEITDQPNAKFHNNRTPGAVACYIRSHFKTKEEKQIFSSNLWCEDEKAFIKYIITHPEGYKYQGTQFHGGYNLIKIVEEFQRKFPDSKRNRAGIKHQIDKLEKKSSEQKNMRISIDTENIISE